MITNYDEYIHEPNCSELDQIPGDYGLPLIGHTVPFFAGQYDWVASRHRQFGKVFKMCMVGTKGVMCLGPEYAQQILLDPDKVFSSKMGFDNRVTEFFGGSFIMEDFEHHRFQRRIAQTAFKNDMLRHYTTEVNGVYHRALDGWDADVGNQIEFFFHIKKILLDVAAEVFVGIQEKSDELNRLNSAFSDCANGIPYVIPWNIPGTAMWRGKRGRAYLEEYFGKLVTERRNGDGLDMLSLFCRELDENGKQFDDQTVVNQIIFLLFAAHDTTTAALTFAIYYLARDPELKERLYQECLSIGTDDLSYDDLNNVPLMGQIFNEVQRLNPSLPVIPRRTIRDVEIGGVPIPAHTLVYAMPKYSHLMEEYWTEPTKFDPDRWSPERAEHKQHPFLFHPFGGGAHKCIGMHFSQMEFKCFLHQFMLRYEFDAKQDDVRMVVFPLAKPVDNMPITLRRRSPL
jgi:cytochrome P450